MLLPCLQEGQISGGDDYYAELDYIEVVEEMKEGYEEDVEHDAEDFPTRHNPSKKKSSDGQFKTGSAECCEFPSWKLQRDPYIIYYSHFYLNFQGDVMMKNIFFSLFITLQFLLQMCLQNGGGWVYNLLVYLFISTGATQGPPNLWHHNFILKLNIFNFML